jgi:hypothetical protein
MRTSRTRTISTVCRRNQHVAFGPGDAGYVQQVKAYDDAFAAFFTKLADGLTRAIRCLCLQLMKAIT